MSYNMVGLDFGRLSGMALNRKSFMALTDCSRPVVVELGVDECDVEAFGMEKLWGILRVSGGHFLSFLWWVSF